MNIPEPQLRKDVPEKYSLFSQTLVPTAPGSACSPSSSPEPRRVILRKWATAQRESVPQNGLQERKEASVALPALRSTPFLLLVLPHAFQRTYWTPHYPPPPTPHPRVLISQALPHPAHYPQLCYLNELFGHPSFSKDVTSALGLFPCLPSSNSLLLGAGLLNLLGLPFAFLSPPLPLRAPSPHPFLSQALQIPGLFAGEKSLLQRGPESPARSPVAEEGEAGRRARAVGERGSRSSPRACKNAAGGRGPGEPLTPRAPDPGLRTPPAGPISCPVRRRRRGAGRSGERGAGGAHHRSRSLREPGENRGGSGRVVSRESPAPARPRSVGRAGSAGGVQPAERGARGARR